MHVDGWGEKCTKGGSHVSPGVVGWIHDRGICTMYLTCFLGGWSGGRSNMVSNIRPWVAHSSFNTLLRAVDHEDTFPCFRAAQSITLMPFNHNPLRFDEQELCLHLINSLDHGISKMQTLPLFRLLPPPPFRPSLRLSSFRHGFRPPPVRSLALVACLLPPRARVRAP